MSANAGPLPFLPPPPSPPPPPANQRPSLIAHLPPECRPKVDSLMHLIINFDNDECFDQEERQQLRDSDVGNELLGILQRCNDPRANTMASMKLLEDEADDSSEKVHSMNLLRLQTCVLRASCCFDRVQKYEQCWTNISRRMIAQGRRELEISKSTCQSERQALERCAGNLVARSVREAIAMEDSSILDNDGF